MSCNNRNIRNIDTSIYTQTSGCCQDDCKVRIVERIVPYYVCPPRPQPPFPPAPPFPPEPEVPIVAPTTSYAQFINNSATGATFAAGENIAFPIEQLNTDKADIINNNGVITLSGGRNGRAYLISYQVTGTNNAATIGIAINGSVDTNTQNVLNGDTATAQGKYIVYVPANTTSTVSVRVVSGTITGASPTVGTNLSVIRIA